MKAISLPNKIEDALPALSELLRRSVDGTVPPLFVDYENQRVLIRSTTASAGTSVFEIALWGSITTGGVGTYLSTANFRNDVNVTGATNSSGTSNWTNVTAGLLNITSTASFRSALSVTGNVESSGTVNIKANATASALDILSAAPTTPRANTIFKENVVKAWVSYDTLSGGITTLNDSFNVSSLTDDGIGLTTVNWATGLANATYSLTGMASSPGISDGMIECNAAPVAGSTQFKTADPFATSAAKDLNTITVIMIGKQ